MNNLEALLADHDSDLFNALDCDCCVYHNGEKVCIYDFDMCERGTREWLLSEHVDANDDLPPENDVSTDDVDANDANDALDSREKLEAEVRKWCGMYPYQADMVWVWLNRQAAITANELISLTVDEESPIKGENDTTKCDIRDLGDSREKLEADMRERLGELWADAWDAGNRDSMDDDFDLSVFIALLDRQAAITERETEKKWSCFSDSAGGHIAELTKQLESAHAKNRALKAHIAKMQEGRHGWHIKGKELQQQVDSLKRKLEAATDANTDYRDEWHRVCAERANLARDLGNAMAERDRYRELCSKLLDAADEMRRVRDQFDAFTEVD